MSERPSMPPLSLAHATLAVRDLDRMVAFYGDVLGFTVTDRGAPAPGLDDMVFLSQDPAEHHQIVLVVDDPGTPGFVLADHLAFRTGSLDDLRTIAERLAAAGVEGVIPVSHGNAWSLYFGDPEGNGVECFVDTPLHVPQPHAGSLDLAADDDAIEAATRAEVAGIDGVEPVEAWRTGHAARIDAGRG